MSEFAKTFLRDGVEDGEYFGIFGKHPGWDDHIEDLPLPTMSMAVAKQLLYVRGIGSQISSGAWARLAEDARLPDFDHAFLWMRGRQCLAGRMWASRDGKKRAHFPMIALYQGVNVQPDAVVGSMLARLEKIAAGVRLARSAEKVREIIASQANHSTEAMAEEGPTVLHLNRTAVSKFTRDLRGNLAPGCRVGADPADLSGTLRFWARVSGSLVSPEMPLLWIAPVGASWIDVLAREPMPTQFFCLRAKPPALAMTYSANTQEPTEELDAAEAIKTATEGKGGGGRSWFARMMGH
ncbi:hypothetical protein CfE428DRAFT_2859 [Chthoniobacter flavus Ellin428]|uniref:Uncharacterized protein n=1 Tax=Chthoniobacter flavus Ellin428 TaxID=497964 RepID=B4D1S1_9BACT|nr:hypothetical protein [Chthoniobacter flavus]EDY19683.1 hypothetical protein CfE428DRAFT_2859 [Chthoniobacter flavus Ellin428]TCO92916.1 hypothetical protein EV701_105193 [Chthoniobacter flavus]